MITRTLVRDGLHRPPSRGLTLSAALAELLELWDQVPSYFVDITIREAYAVSIEHDGDVHVFAGPPDDMRPLLQLVHHCLVLNHYKNRLPEGVFSVVCDITQPPPPNIPMVYGRASWWFALVWCLGEDIEPHLSRLYRLKRPVLITMVASRFEGRPLEEILASLR